MCDAKAQDAAEDERTCNWLSPKTPHPPLHIMCHQKDTVSNLGFTAKALWAGSNKLILGFFQMSKFTSVMCNETVKADRESVNANTVKSDADRHTLNQAEHVVGVYVVGQKHKKQKRISHTL